MNEKDYEILVRLAKKELKAIEGHEIRICEYAMKVVTIRHGGHSSGYYTITDFARDIGMENKTLQNWLLTYRNVIQKLNKPITTSAEFSRARKTENILREERIIKNRINEKPVGSRYAQSQPADPAHVQRIYDAYSIEEKPFQAEFSSVLRSTKHTLNLLKKRDLSIIEDEQLSYLMQVMDEASDIINSYLTKKKRQNGRAA